MTRLERLQANLDAARTGLMYARRGLEAAKAEGDPRAVEIGETILGNAYAEVRKCTRALDAHLGIR